VEVLDRAVVGPRMVQLEEVSSGWAIASAARDEALEQMRRGRTDWIVLRNAHGDPGSITAEQVALAAIERDAQAEAILDRARRALAFALRQAVALLAPRRIILGGGVSLIGESHWFKPLRELVDADVFPPFQGSFDIVAAALGEEVVVRVRRHGNRCAHRHISPVPTKIRVCSGRWAFARASLPASRFFRQVRLGRSLALPLLEQSLSAVSSRREVKQWLLGAFASRMKKRSMLGVLSWSIVVWRSTFMRGPSAGCGMGQVLAADRHSSRLPLAAAGLF
jgi:hypothetical protein